MDLIKQWVRRQLSNPQVVMLAALLLIIFMIIFFLGDLLAPVFAALVIAYLLDGIILRFQRRGAPRLAAVCGVYLLFLLAVFMLFFVVIPSLVSELDKFVRRDVPGIVQNASKDIQDAYTRYELFKSQRIATLLNGPSKTAQEPESPLSQNAQTKPTDSGIGQQPDAERPIPDTGNDTSLNMDRFTETIERQLTDFGRTALSFSITSLKSIVVWIVYLVLVPVMVFFILKDKEPIARWFVQFLPEERGLTNKVWHEVNQQTSNYVRGKFWEVMIVWGVTFVTFSIFGLRATLLLSLFVGLSVLVPYVGATLMYIPIGIIGFYQFGASSAFAWLIIAYSIIQVLDGNVLAPVLMSEATSLHPIAVIVAILIFGGLWGFWGVFFAIPLATLINSIIKAWPMETSVSDSGPP
jgi:putative permease